MKWECKSELQYVSDDECLKRYKFAWHLLLDTESVPQSGTNAEAKKVALDFVYGDSKLTEPLRRYRDVVGAALFVENALDVVIATAERKRDAARAENAAHVCEVRHDAVLRRHSIVRSERRSELLPLR